MKTCKKCGATKSLDQFYKTPGGRFGRRAECIACTRADRKAHYEANREEAIARVKRWQQANPDRVREVRKQNNQRPERKAALREGHLLRKFGISLADYDELLAAQGGGCALCGTPPPEDGSLHVDHDHTTGRVRGLLCVRCNIGLGQLGDDVEVLSGAIGYVVRQDEYEAPARARLAELIGGTTR